MFTRADYMQNRCTHREYYVQFVSDGICNLVRLHIGEERIKSSTDPHFNDIPLRLWDSLDYSMRAMCASKLREAGSAGMSLFDTVCIAKEAAQQIREKANAL